MIGAGLAFLPESLVTADLEEKRLVTLTRGRHAAVSTPHRVDLP